MCHATSVLAYSSDLSLCDYAVTLVISEWALDLSIITIHNRTSEAIPVMQPKGKELL